MSWRRWGERIAADIRQGQHREAYAIFGVGIVLTILGIVEVAKEHILLSAMLLAVTFLAFRTTIDLQRAAPKLEEVLRDRKALGTFSQVLPDGGELWVYGPTAVTVLVNAAEIRRKVLERGGQVRILVQDPDSEAISFTRAQLDANLDFDHILRSSISTLRKMRSWGDCQHRLLAFNPGFSLVIINPTKRDGFALVEFHGFEDESITDRMHVRISRSESIHWFDYWTDRFQAMWQSAREDDAHEIPAAHAR